MAHFLCGYDYEPEYTAKEIEVPFFVLLFFVPGSSAYIAVCLQQNYNYFVYILFCTPLLQVGAVAYNFYRHTSSWFQLNCHFHAKYMILLNINLHFKPYIFKVEFPFKCPVLCILQHLLSSHSFYSCFVCEEIIIIIHAFMSAHSSSQQPLRCFMCSCVCSWQG